MALFHIYKPQLDAKDVQSEPLNQLPVIRTSADSIAFPAKSVLCLWLLTFGPFYIFSIAIGLRFFILPTPWMSWGARRTFHRCIEHHVLSPIMQDPDEFIQAIALFSKFATWTRKARIWSWHDDLGTKNFLHMWDVRLWVEALKSGKYSTQWIVEVVANNHERCSMSQDVVHLMAQLRFSLKTTAESNQTTRHSIFSSVAGRPRKHRPHHLDNLLRQIVDMLLQVIGFLLTYSETGEDGYY